MIHPYFIQMTIFQNFTVNILTDQWTKKYPKFPDKAKSEPWLTLKRVTIHLFNRSDAATKNPTLVYALIV